MLIAQLEDKIEQCSDNYKLTNTGFLDMHQKKVAVDFCRSGKVIPAGVKVEFYGGYEDAERCILVCLPDYIQDVPNDEEGYMAELLRVIRVNTPKGGRKLTHRDYLGSLLSLGITRDVIGDILVRNEGADIVVLAEIADFIAMNYHKAGRTNFSAEILSISELDRGTINIEEKQDTVASLRLDNIVASAFGLSRTKAAEAIRKGVVSVNSMEALKVDMEIRECDKIVMRGKGKVVLAEIGGISRKDRIRIKINAYK